MGALVELFCSIFEILARIEEKRNPNAGCFAVLATLVMSAILTIGLIKVLLG